MLEFLEGQNLIVICLNFATLLNMAPLLRLLMRQNAQKAGTISCLDDLMGCHLFCHIVVIIFNVDIFI